MFSQLLALQSIHWLWLLLLTPRRWKVLKIQVQDLTRFLLFSRPLSSNPWFRSKFTLPAPAWPLSCKCRQPHANFTLLCLNNKIGISHLKWPKQDSWFSPCETILSVFFHRSVCGFSFHWDRIFETRMQEWSFPLNSPTPHTLPWKYILPT